MTISQPMNLLEKTQSLIELERSLTRTLERVEPWLTNSDSNNKGKGKTGMRIRPIPTSMDEVHKVLAVARNFSSRTSAPAGWNPNAPVIGFSTPNPLPHQLRGGALAALELQRARQAEKDKKRIRQEELEEQNKEKAKQKTEETNKNKGDADGGDNKKQVTADKKDIAPRKQQNINHPQPHARSTSHSGQRVAMPEIATTMNLSDSSSEDESESDSD